MSSFQKPRRDTSDKLHESRVIKSLLHSRARSIWRRVTVIRLLKTVWAWTKVIVRHSESKSGVPRCLRVLRIAVAPQAIGIGHAGARPGTSAAWRQLHIGLRQKRAAEDKPANAQAKE